MSGQEPRRRSEVSNGTLLITGASRGIGAATARLASARGFPVCVNYRFSRAEAELLVAELTSAGAMATAVQADVSIEKDVLNLFRTCDQTLPPLVGLVNNAAILERQTTVKGISPERLHRILAVNVIGSFLCAREAIRRMSTAEGGRGGSIVNVSSGAARWGSPGEYVDYAASKGALDTFTIGLAQEVAAEGIRVNAVRPAFIYTAMHASGGEPNRVERVKSSVPMRRGGTAEEVAHAILWLLSSEASYTTGAFIDVTGGR